MKSVIFTVISLFSDGFSAVTFKIGKNFENRASEKNQHVNKRYQKPVLRSEHFCGNYRGFVVEGDGGGWVRGTRRVKKQTRSSLHAQLKNMTFSVFSEKSMFFACHAFVRKTQNDDRQVPNNAAGSVNR